MAHRGVGGEAATRPRRRRPPESGCRSVPASRRDAYCLPPSSGAAEITGSNGSNIYWSVENNSIGEAALLVISELGEEHIPGLFLSEPMRKGHVRKFRKGFNTTHGSKISACARLKTMIENDTLKINSKPLISELKNYVATGASYAAKLEMTDDLVSSMLLALRMIHVMKDWDPVIYDTFNQIEKLDEGDLPMPIFISSNF